MAASSLNTSVAVTTNILEKNIADLAITHPEECVTVPETISNFSEASSQDSASPSGESATNPESPKSETSEYDRIVAMLRDSSSERSTSPGSSSSSGYNRLVGMLRKSAKAPCGYSSSESSYNTAAEPPNTETATVGEAFIVGARTTGPQTPQTTAAPIHPGESSTGGQAFTMVSGVPRPVPTGPKFFRRRRKGKGRAQQQAQDQTQAEFATSAQKVFSPLAAPFFPGCAWNSLDVEANGWAAAMELQGWAWPRVVSSTSPYVWLPPEKVQW
ncbi:hypothetical protein G7Y89_g2585 [Cudoniella acicularis]|uniref:Uncharacterized protein n=1 Tax=Cudoniella acicularis TaxID=354080 RepID=A0A8H4RT16_9HELO|nr:hypothetical protein G7Y89_g2585 [Cudoniella acicularis]